MPAENHARQGRQRFALRPRHDEDKLVVRQVRHAVVGVEKLRRNAGYAEIPGDLDVVGKGFSADDDRAPPFAGEVEDLLYALYVA